MAAALKTAVGLSPPGVRIPPPPLPGSLSAIFRTIETCWLITFPERWPSGLWQLPRKQPWDYPHRAFESPSLRQTFNLHSKAAAIVAAAFEFNLLGLYPFSPLSFFGPCSVCELPPAEAGGFLVQRAGNPTLPRRVRSRRSIGTFGIAEKCNVPGGVFVSVVVRPAGGASPLPIGQPQVLVDVPANVTAFAGWEEAVNLVEARPVPLALIRQLTEQFSPPTIDNPLGEMVVSHHPLHVQVFGVDDLVLVHKPTAELVQEILAGVYHLFMLTGNSKTGVLSIVRAFLAAGE